MTFVTVRPERKGKRSKKPGAIVAFKGDIRVDGARLVVTPSRGAKVRLIDTAEKSETYGEQLREYEDHLRTLALNLGDRVMVWGPSIDEIVVGIVLVVSRDGTSVWVQPIRGKLEESTTRARLFQLAPSRAARQLDLLAKKKRRRG